jgi:heme/copper-type cytochrome/quinol oxidase subunit 2
MERLEYHKPDNRAAKKAFLFVAAIKQSYFRRYATERNDTMNPHKFIKNKIIEAGWTLFDISLIGLAIYIFFIK